MVLWGRLGHALLLDGGRRREGFRPLLVWSYGCHRGRSICDVEEGESECSFGSYTPTTLARRRSLRSSLGLSNTFLRLQHYQHLLAVWKDTGTSRPC